MISRLLPLGIVAMLGAVAPAQALVTQFADNFSSGATSQTDRNDVNFNLAGRQSGPTAPLAYSEYAATAVATGETFAVTTTNGGTLSRVDDPLSPGALVLGARGGANFTNAASGDNRAGGNPSYTYVAPGFNFGSLGNNWTAQFDVNAGLATTLETSADWAGLRFGDTLRGRFINDGTTGEGYGILFRRNGGYQLFGGATFTNNNVNTGAVTGTALPGGFFSVRVDSRSEGSDARITITLDEVGTNQSVSFLRTGGFGATSRYMSLVNTSGTTPATIGEGASAFDNLRISSVAPVPEPATLAALGLGALALVRRRKAAR